MAGAASGFVTKTFQSMLKESFAKKFTTLHFAIQSYLDDIKEEKKQHVSKRTKSFIQWSQNGSFTKIFLIKAFIFKINVLNDLEYQMERKICIRLRGELCDERKIWLMNLYE
ncbi:uncharacterized protein LOC141599634 isoform X2 [Silene latifolia]|uniref:uncharacterized protein LOC141599634 isoform X2 n=1 Tax=Silene latifolia TaxID=37657 RepID=UPI003D76C3BA